MARPNQTEEARLNRLASMTRLARRGRRPRPAPDPEARSFEGRSRLKTACEIRLDRIVADPNQPRVEFDPESLERLAASLRQRGQLQPIRVRWDEALDRYVVVVGERRWRAARLAGHGVDRLRRRRRAAPRPRRSWRTSSSRTACAKTSGRSSRPGRSGPS